MTTTERLRTLGAGCTILLLVITGLAVIAYAGWLWSPPLGYALAGLGLLYLAYSVRLAVGGDKTKP